MKKIKILLLLIIISHILNLSLIAKVQVSKTKNMTGVHQEIDNVGNKYYYSNSTDIAGYGDFRAHYKNGETYKIKYKGEILEDTLDFTTLDHEVDGLAKNTIVFCIQPDEMAQIIDSTDQNANAYNDLTPIQKEDVAKLTSAITYEFSKTGNYDYLSAGQLLVWEAVGSELILVPSSIHKEMEDINNLVDKYDIIPSFFGSNNTLNLELTYNENTLRYEAYLEDTNHILDEHFLSTLIGQSNGYHLEDGPGVDDLYIWTDNPPIYTQLISSTYTIMPNVSGDKAGLHYTVEPTFINSGQDLVSGINYKVKIQLNLTTKIAKGEAKLKKCGYIKTECVPLEGVLFGLYNDKGQEIIEEKTNGDGEINFKDLDLGHYYVQELQTKDEYAIDKTKYEFDIIKDEDIALINAGEYIENNLIKGTVRLNKVGITQNNDNTLSPLEGVEFTIYEDVDGNGLVDSEDEAQEVLITDENGQIISSDLDYGHYVIKETQALEGYINNGYEEAFFIQNQGEVINLAGGMDLINDIKTGYVDLLKVGEDLCFECEYIPLQGVEFGVYEDFDQNNLIDEDDLLVQTITTDEMGYAKSNQLIYGQYNVVELKTNQGYQISDQVYPFEINDDKDVTLNLGEPIINKLELTKIIINKHDQFGNLIPDVEFNLYKDQNQDGEVSKEEFLAQVTTDQNGQIKKSLPQGNYILQEISTPNGYIKSDENYTFYIDGNNKEDTIIDIQNNLILGDLKIVKKDVENDAVLEGVQFDLYKDLDVNGKINKDDKLIDTYITDQNGQIIIKDLEYGKYLLQEVKPLEGYSKNKQIYEIDIDGSKDIYELEVYNQKIIKQITQKLVNTSTGKKVFVTETLVLIGVIFLVIFLLIIYFKKDKRNYI